MSFLVPITISPAWQRRYFIWRALMYIVIIFLTANFALRALFPTVEQSLNFRAPNSSKNAIAFPRSPDGAIRTNGKIEQGGTMVADTTAIGDFSSVRVSALLERKSAIPEKLQFSLKRSYQSFYYPTADPVSAFPEETLYHIDDTYYALRSGTLYPFVSDQAYLSRCPKDRALERDHSFLKQYPVSEDWLGFRPGALIANTTGIFLVMDDTTVRPFGRPDIFLSMGYRFDDVITVSEEELGIYKRDRIILLGAAHPDGTVLSDQDTGNYFLIEQSKKHPLLPGTYRDFLLATQHPVIVSSQRSALTVDCTLLPDAFGTTFSCRLPIDTLPSGYGNDYELEITSPDTAIDINTLTVSFETAKKNANILSLLSQIKQMLLIRMNGQ